MTPSHANSIALLIDADNAPAGKIDFILSELASHGVVNIRRAYGFKKLVDLFEAIDLFEVKREKSATHPVISVRIAKVGGKKVKVITPPADDIDIPF